jgi:uncharacterized repeat protein (TIGR03803 family)
MNLFHRLILGAFLLFSTQFCPAGVVVSQNVSPGATSWPGSPSISTMANPSATATVIESFNGGGGNTNLSQTFTVTSGCVLQTIDIYAGTGSGTGTGTNLVLKLYDLGIQTAPNPSPYTASIVGANLLGSGAGLSVSYVSQTAGVLEFDFTGVDQVTLTSGHMYAFELTGVLNTTPVFWSRGTTDTYSGGAAYRNQAWINGSNARDFALAVYTSPIPSTNNWPMPSGIIFHSFSTLNSGINQDGANPAAGLVLSGGVLCGTTANGGSQGAGTAFYLAPDASSFNAFRSFANAPDAANPQGDLVISGNNLFGTSFGGGTNGVGTVFVAQTNGVVSRIRDFAVVDSNTATNAAGASPDAAVTLSPSGSVLFGTASAGGFFANGTVFSVTTNGATSSVLHTFTALDSNAGTNADGATPLGALAISGGTLYGTTSAGGAGGNGTVFSVSTNGNNFTTLYSFTALDPVTGTNTDGAIPYGGLVLSNGVLYGTTMAGGFGKSGVIFSVATNGGGFTVLHHFTSVDPTTKTNTDGVKPVANLLLVGGTLYGTAPAGGSGASGTVFFVSTNGGQFQTLYNFSAVNSSNGTNADGAIPDGDLLLLGTSLYGTTFAGGFGAAGTVFSLSLPLPPAVITRIVHNPDGSVTLSFLGSPNSTNVIQATTVLGPSASWQNISTNTADTGGSWQFTDPTANQFPSQFYRSYSR